MASRQPKRFGARGGKKIDVAGSGGLGRCLLRREKLGGKGLNRQRKRTWGGEGGRTEKKLWTSLGDESEAKVARWGRFRLRVERCLVKGMKNQGGGTVSISKNVATESLE